MGGETERMKIQNETELTPDEIWELLTEHDFQVLKQYFYDHFIDDYKEWLEEDGS